MPEPTPESKSQKSEETPQQEQKPVKTDWSLAEKILADRKAAAEKAKQYEL